MLIITFLLALGLAVDLLVTLLAPERWAAPSRRPALLAANPNKVVKREPARLRLLSGDAGGAVDGRYGARC